MKIEIITPPFERPSNWPPLGQPPSSIDEWNSLREMPYEVLYDLGLRPWNADDARALMLLPADWYDLIPDGIALESIRGDLFTFDRRDPARSNDDRRFGYLAYGVRVPEKIDA